MKLTIHFILTGCFALVTGGLLLAVVEHKAGAHDTRLLAATAGALLLIAAYTVLLVVFTIRHFAAGRIGRGIAFLLLSCAVVVLTVLLFWLAGILAVASPHSVAP